MLVLRGGGGGGSGGGGGVVGADVGVGLVAGGERCMCFVCVIDIPYRPAARVASCGRRCRRQFVSQFFPLKAACLQTH